MSTKGARSIATVPPDHLERLNNGTAETRTLSEGLALSFPHLLAAVVPRLADVAAIELPSTLGITQRMARAAVLLHEAEGDALLPRLLAHPSDTVRGWGAYLIAALPGLSLAERVAQMRPLADDPHFGVREWAWLALRPAIAADIDTALSLLVPWTAEPSANLRRFASEATRPRGVWCVHIGALKTDPAQGLPLLLPLRRDDSPYVQDSVGNWLNDAAKSQPDWVAGLIADWRRDSAIAPRLLKRAGRSLG